MFFHAFRKVFFVNESCKPLPYPDIVQHTIKNYKEIHDTDPFLHNFYHQTMFQYKSDGTENPLMHIFLVKNKEWNQLISDYCYYLGLDYQAYLKIVQHSSFCTKYIDNCSETISTISQTIVIPEKDFKINTHKRVVDYIHFPAEYAINCLDQEWAQKKYEYFRIYDLYNHIKNLQIQCRKEEKPIPALLTLFQENDQAAKKLLKDSTLKEKILKFFSNYIDISPYSIPIQDYVEQEPNLGYDRFTFYKFNWPLARYLKKIQYKIHG